MQPGDKVKLIFLDEAMEVTHRKGLDHFPDHPDIAHLFGGEVTVKDVFPFHGDAGTVDVFTVEEDKQEVGDIPCKFEMDWIAL